MKQRIQELAEQANNAIGGNAFSMARYNEKFAELIAAECAYLARQCYTVSAAQADNVAQHIEENFGR